jgi:hypothetical protein
MPISDIDQQIALVQTVGDVDPANGDPVSPTAQGVTGIVMANINRLWLKYSGQPNTTLRDLRIQLEAHDLVIARLESLVDISTNNGQISVKLSQRVSARREQRASVWAEIVRAESMLARSAAVQIGAIAITSPIAVPGPGSRSSPSLYPDANDPRWSGSPYWRSRRPSW